MDTTATMNAIEEQFQVIENQNNVPEKKAFLTKRREAFDQFQSLGFPSKKNEEFRYLDLGDLNPEDYSVAEAYQNSSMIGASDFAVPYLDTNLFVFIDGYFSPEHSQILDTNYFFAGKLEEMESKIYQTYFCNADLEDNPFVSLNFAFSQEGVYAHVPKGKIVEHPVQILHINTGTEWVQPNHLFVVEENAQIQIIESYFSLQDVGIDNSYLRIVAKSNAIVDHYKIQALGEKAKQFGFTSIEQDRHANCSTHVYNLGGHLVRNNISIDLEEDHTEANMYGLYVTDDSEVVDNHTLVNHKQPNCVSNQLYKGIANGKSKAVFNGKIFVQRNAQVTNAFQSNNNIVLSDNASINTKPQLEIWADDVRCSHGATIGKLNPDEVFYLQARGINREKAMSMLTYAFAGEVLTHIKIPQLRNFLEEGVAAKLGFSMDS